MVLEMLFFVLMEIQLKVIRVLPNEMKEVYRNTIKVPVGISFPYDAMIDSLRWLYPGCLYQFNIM